MAHGKTIEMFLVDGTADKIVTAELSNWNGKAIKIPRIEVKDCNRDELTKPGVYFLFCKGDDGKDSVYIGEAESIKDRLLQHIRDYNSDKESYYWNTAVIFIGSDLNKALIRYLEHQLVETARVCKRYDILTKNTYKTALKESQIATMEEYIDNVKILLNALGSKVLEPILAEDSTVATEGILHLKTGGVDAKGRVTTEGFVLMKDTKINSSLNKNDAYAETIIKLRDKYVNNGSLENDIIKEDILFSSSSQAAHFVLGYRVSGPKNWKDESGRLLRELESNK